MSTKKRQITPEGECIRQRLRTNAAFRVLDQTASFQSGGCWIAANAIQRQFGGKLATVTSSRGGAEHFVVERDGLYYDSEGAQTAQQLLMRMAREEFVPAPRIVPYESWHKQRSGADTAEPKVVAIQTLFTRCRPPPARRRDG